MKKIILLASFSLCAFTASAELLCAKNSNNYRVSNGVVAVKLPRLLVTSATACPRGYTQEFSVESATGTLSSGKTMTGVWNAANGLAAATSYIATTISFPKPLAVPPTPQILRTGDPATAQCPGSATAPTAAPGYLCIYESIAFNIAAYNPYSTDTTVNPPAAAREGVALYVYPSSSGVAYAWGSWAVTAP